VTEPAVLPMFPLGSTVFPGQVVPLHVFEPRYRTMVGELLANDADEKLPFGAATFGIALIDRGHEVGGGDSRVAVGCRVEILQAEEFEDGRWGMVVAGVERIEVTEWLDDDPYPRALVVARQVVDNGGGSLTDVESTLRELIATMAEQAGADIPDNLEFSTDPHEHLDQMSALAPLTDFDRQRILEASTTTEQIERLATGLDDMLMLIRSQLGGN